MNSFLSKPPTAKQIDDACRKGTFVYFGNRQKVMGATTFLSRARVKEGEPAGEPPVGHIWIFIWADRKWVAMKPGDVIITKEQSQTAEGVDMQAGTGMRGKRQDGRPSHVGSGVKRKPSSKAAKANNGNLEFEGMEADSRKIAEIENAEIARQDASAAISAANTAYEEAEKRVVKAMHKHGFDPIDNPVYTRHPFGSVILTQTGEVKEKVKFTAAQKKSKKKKNADDSEAAE